PVHAAAERLVPRVAASAERVMLERAPVGPLDGRALLVRKRDRAGDPVRAVPADLDRRLARSLPVDLRARLDAVEPVAERAGRAVADRADQVVDPRSARSHERSFRVKRVAEAVGAEAGVLADAAVVVDGEPDAVIGVAAVRDPFRILRIVEVDPGAGPIA